MPTVTLVVLRVALPRLLSLQSRQSLHPVSTRLAMSYRLPFTVRGSLLTVTHPRRPELVDTSVSSDLDTARSPSIGELSAAVIGKRADGLMFTVHGGMHAAAVQLAAHTAFLLASCPAPPPSSS